MRNVADSIHEQIRRHADPGKHSAVQERSTIGRNRRHRGAAKFQSQNLSVDFPFYAVRLFQPWLSDADKNSRGAASAIAQWQPSNPIEDSQNNLYVFRISGSEASHLPAMSDVRDQVVADCKIAAAYAKALQVGHLLFSSANNLGLDTAVARTKLPPPIVTQPFSPEAISTGRAPAVIEPLILASDSAANRPSSRNSFLTTSPTKTIAASFWPSFTPIGRSP